MKHLFLSYSRKDTDVMHRVRDTLRAEGFAVWTDEKLTPGTSQWSREIQNAIATSGAIVVLLSPDSNASEWVANEIGYAKSHKLDIFPILVRGEEHESVPIELIRVQRVDIRTRFLGQMQDLVDIIQEHIQANPAEVSQATPLPVAKEVSDEPDTFSHRELERFKFWTGLLQRGKTKTRLFSNINPRYDSWINSSAGRSGNHWTYTITKDWAAIELYIDFDQQTGKKNKELFDYLKAQQAQIETDFGDSIDWRRLDDKRASRVIKYYYSSGLDMPEKWEELQEQMIDGMIKLENALKPHLRSFTGY